ncbi:hypothetical protein AMS68_000104 [Peltaster fructicola]|uniref:Uncharacterized protein n=1 Tax=Peltaster fructicola TaxID=286661 RepID=A0A6H0XIN6_9PEZI|nr:hypothetical protein AMS68_000104 [Peltaster fructicola]
MAKTKSQAQIERDAKRNLEVRVNHLKGRDKRHKLTAEEAEAHLAMEAAAGHKIGVKGKSAASEAETLTGRTGGVEAGTLSEQEEEEEDEEEEEEEKVVVTGRTGTADEAEFTPVSEQSTSSAANTTSEDTVAKAVVAPGITTPPVSDKEVVDTKTPSHKQTERSAKWAAHKNKGANVTTAFQSVGTQTSDVAESGEISFTMAEVEKIKAELTALNSATIEEYDKRIRALEAEHQTELSRVNEKLKSLEREHVAETSRLQEDLKTLQMQNKLEIEHRRSLESSSWDANTQLQSKLDKTSEELAKKDFGEQRPPPRAQEGRDLPQRAHKVERELAKSKKENKASLDLIANHETAAAEASSKAEALANQNLAISGSLRAAEEALQDFQTCREQLEKEKDLHSSVADRLSALLTGLGGLCTSTFADHDSVEEILQQVSDSRKPVELTKPELTLSSISTVVDMAPSMPELVFSGIIATVETEPEEVEENAVVSQPALGLSEITAFIDIAPTDVDTAIPEQASQAQAGKRSLFWEYLLALFLLIGTATFVEQHREASILPGMVRYVADVSQGQFVLDVVEALLGVDCTYYG